MMFVSKSVWLILSFAAVLKFVQGNAVTSTVPEPQIISNSTNSNGSNTCRTATVEDKDYTFGIPESEITLYPLDPLTSSEIRLAVYIIEETNNSKTWSFKSITLKEPEKTLLLQSFQDDDDITVAASGKIERRSCAILTDLGDEKRILYEVIVNLNRITVESWEQRDDFKQEDTEALIFADNILIIQEKNLTLWELQVKPKPQNSQSYVHHGHSQTLHLHGHKLQWRNFIMRIGYTAREGVILHHVKLKSSNNSHFETVAYRMSLLGILVNSKTGGATALKNVFSSITYGSGSRQTCSEFDGSNIKDVRFLSMVFIDDLGQPYTEKNAICIQLHSDTETPVTGKLTERSTEFLSINSVAITHDEHYLISWRLYEDLRMILEVKAVQSKQNDNISSSTVLSSQISTCP